VHRTPARRRARLRWAALLCALAGAGPLVRGAPPSASAILQELRSFRELGSVLYIAAHPDDENTRLIAYFARGRNYRTAYLSLTRGDGGQDLLGPELGEELGVIRTQELLAARRIDGGRQFFTRARDFGFSKDYADTLRRWDRQQVLSDIVRVIREFRPDILVTRFSTVPGGTHGHHTASAVLALEAFRLAGDPKAFPEQLARLTPWQPKRILWNNGFGPSSLGRSVPRLQLDDGGYDALLGESYGEIAARSRSMHKSQGMGAIGTRGAAVESFQLLDGAPATRDILEGVDTSWGRFPGGADIGPMATDLITRFNPEDPAASVPALLALRTRRATLAADPVVAEKRALLDRILADCLGLHVETTIAHAEVVPGETLALRHTVIVRAHVPVRWLDTRYPTGADGHFEAVALAHDRPASRAGLVELPADTPPSTPYWLREEGTPGMFRVDDPALIGRPENPPVFPIEEVFAVGGQELVVTDEPVQVVADPVRGELREALAVVPPVTLGWTDDLTLLAPGASRSAVVEIVAARPVAGGQLRIEAPPGWTAAPAAQPFAFARAGEKRRLTFTITAPPEAVTGYFVPAADIAGRTYRNGRQDIRYDHIPGQLLQPPARLKAVSLDLAIKSRQVGYLAGAGDEVAASIARMGCVVTPLSGADLTPERLRSFDAVVIGVRAFNTRTDLIPRLPALWAYVQGGGDVIELYNRPNGLQGVPIAPYPLRLSELRVTDEHAAVTLLAPAHPALTTPNRIAPADFAGWVQERGTYFPSEWDAHFVPILACSDAGEPPREGGLLIAPYGRGYFVYTGLSWFRQLPSGVPGAYRLFANLLSLGK
jgi:LmbE family N-acetylglucosaminyl deacetylase